MVKDKRLSKHFKESEFRCKCGCGALPPGGVDPGLVRRLEMWRAMVSSHCNEDTPLVIASGHRCPRHNEAVGGKPDSAHLSKETGAVIAADVVNPIVGHEGYDTFYEFAKRASFIRRGYYKSDNFAHADISKLLPQTTWTG